MLNLGLNNMEKITFNKIQASPEFKRGRQEFLEGKVPSPEGVKYGWYKAKVPVTKWNEFYSKTSSYTFLAEDGKDVWVGFLAVIPPVDCLEITNLEELRKIDLHRRATSSYPFVFKDKD
jgi:hypothetical protein